MAPTNPTGLVAEAAEDTKKEKKKKKKKEAEEELTTFDDVVIDKTKPLKVGRGPDDTTSLQSIKAVSPIHLLVCALRHFCTIHRINGYKDTSKVLLCNLIVDWMKMKHLDRVHYAEKQLKVLYDK
jgi:hypothetical protein